jgi:Ras-related protein Rab-6A
MAVVSIPSYKVILCGEYGVGKSSIFRRYVDNSFIETQDYMSNIGLDHFAKKFVIFKDCELEVSVRH